MNVTQIREGYYVAENGLRGDALKLYNELLPADVEMNAYYNGMWCVCSEDNALISVELSPNICIMRTRLPNGSWGAATCAEFRDIYRQFMSCKHNANVVYKDKMGDFVLREYDAEYREVILPNQTHQLFKRGRAGWESVFIGNRHGSASQLESYWVKCDTPAEPPVTHTIPVIHNATKVVYERVKGHTNFDLNDINSYLYLCVYRSLVQNAGPVINTRLTDILSQPIYVCYCGDEDAGNINLRNVHVVDTIDDVRRLLPTLQIDVMPAPIQFGHFYDCIWNPTLPILPVSINTYNHICVERVERLPEELKSVPPISLFNAIKASLDEGAKKASTDIAYALPTYSRRSNDIAMLLPLTIPVLNGGKPIAAMMVRKTLQGYQLSTIITLSMAYAGVRLFRDPELTWLKGVK